MIMDALNGVWSNTYILQTMIQQKLQKPNNILKKKLHFEDIKFEKKKNEKKNTIAISIFGYKNKKNTQSMSQKKMLRRKTC